MPLSPDNPNRGRNFVVLVICAVVVFSIVMAGYVALSLAGRETDSYISFLTLLVVNVVPGVLTVWYSFRAKHTAEHVQHDLQNGTLKVTVKEAIQEANGIGDESKST